MHERSAIVLLLASLAACGGNNSEFTASGSIAVADLPSELAQALCQAEKDCNPFFYGVAFSNADCQAVLTEQLEESAFTQIEVAVTAKTVNYDADKARSCISAVNAGSCSVLDNNLPAICREALSGTVATGGDCDIDAQCSGLSRCEVSGDTCPGTCAPLASAGIACTRDGDCALGLTCSDVTQHCVSPASEGDACKGPSGAECAAGLLCIGNDDDKKVAGTCQTAAAALVGKLGESCDLQAGPWCAAGLSCVVESVTPPTYKCHASAPTGGACGLGLPTECPQGQFCPLDFGDLVLGKLTANCQALPAQGQACAPALSFSRCAGNLVCDDTTTPLAPVCVERRTLGQSCSSDALCNSQRCLNQVCVPESVCAK